MYGTHDHTQNCIQANSLPFRRELPGYRLVAWLRYIHSLSFQQPAPPLLVTKPNRPRARQVRELVLQRNRAADSRPGAGGHATCHPGTAHAAEQIGLYVRRLAGESEMRASSLWKPIWDSEIHFGSKRASDVQSSSQSSTTYIPHPYRVFLLLNPRGFDPCCSRWMSELQQLPSFAKADCVATKTLRLPSVPRWKPSIL